MSVGSSVCGRYDGVSVGGVQCVRGRQESEGVSVESGVCGADMRV